MTINLSASSKRIYALKCVTLNQGFNIVKYIKNKMFGKEKEREDYWNFSKDLYTHNIFSDKTIESIQDDYIWNKENAKGKEKDDYEIEM